MPSNNERNEFLDQLFEKEYALVERTCWHMVNYQRHYDDVVNTSVQEVFLAAARKYSEIKDHNNLTGWLVDAAHKSMRYQLRTHKNRSPVDSIPLGENMSSVIDGLDQWYEQNRESEIIEQIRNIVTQKEWPIFKQFYIDRDSVSEIAKDKNVSVSSVTSALHRLRKRIVSNMNWPFILLLLICVTFL